MGVLAFLLLYFVFGVSFGWSLFWSFVILMMED